jgi:hypothetical protein
MLIDGTQASKNHRLGFCLGNSYGSAS